MENIKSILQKIERLSSSDAIISNIERDLMLQYTRSLYELLLDLDVEPKNLEEKKEEIDKDDVMQTESAPTIMGEEERANEPIDSTSQTEKEHILPSTTENKEIQISDDLDFQYKEEDDFIEEPILTEEEIQLNPEEDGSEEDVDLEFEVTVMDIPEPTSEDEIVVATLQENLFLKEPETDHLTPTQASSITDFKVWNKDIRSYIGINDKYNFISELFGNNHEAYDEILNELNLCESKTEALQFLENSGITTLYQWKEDGFSEQIFYNVLSQFFSSR